MYKIDMKQCIIFWFLLVNSFYVLSNDELPEFAVNGKSMASSKIPDFVPIGLSREQDLPLKNPISADVVAPPPGSIAGDSVVPIQMVAIEKKMKPAKDKNGFRRDSLSVARIKNVTLRKEKKAGKMRLVGISSERAILKYPGGGYRTFGIGEKVNGDMIVSINTRQGIIEMSSGKRIGLGPEITSSN